MNKQAVLSVNIAVLLFGLAGLFAKWITLPALFITFGRVLISSITLGLFIGIRDGKIRLPNRKGLLLMICAGIIVAVHWWAFLESIQRSTVAVGTVTFASFPLFVTIIEPLVFRQKIIRRNVLYAIIILIGVIVTVPEFSFENRIFMGIIIGMISSLAYAVITVMNKHLAPEYGSTLTAFYEQSTAAVFLLPVVLRINVQPSLRDLGLLLILGVFTTALAHTLFIAGLEKLPAQLVGIFSSMETVYSILFAIIFLGEIPSRREIIGAVIILAVVFTSQFQNTNNA